MPKPSDGPAVEFRDVVKAFRRRPAHPAGIKESLLRFPALLRERRSAGETLALDGLSFRLGRGKSLGLCGPNGSGKSTALSLAAGILRPTRGTVVTDGRISSLLGLGAGFHPELTGRENVHLNGTILGMTRRETAERFDEIAAFSGIESFLDQPSRTYSSGMLLRLGFSVAVHTRPEILIVDEVLSVGDIGFHRRCMERMKRFRDEGVTLLLATHSYDMVKELCDRAIILKSGRVLAEGVPADIEADYYSLA